ncbi:MAG TPA: hypothetical protein VGW34_13390 [Allosphingosinicella sp.]|nr:hypothetical protein [Allosphingosinicella sp.]
MTLEGAAWAIAWLVVPAWLATSGGSLIELVLYCLSAGAFLSVFGRPPPSDEPTQVVAGIIINMLAILFAGGTVYAVASALLV